MKGKNWFISFILISAIVLGIIGFMMYEVDPYFHFHAPKTDKYYYKLSTERSQNDGIIKHFDYDAMIIGSSMAENFKTSDVDMIFNCKSIKTPFSGGSYKEINDAVEKAIKVNKDLKLVIRCLDYYMILTKPDYMRTDLGTYPTYLYDDNPFNDVEYIFNRDIIFKKMLPMLVEKSNDNFSTGITSFDEYSRWQDEFDFGINSVLPDGLVVYKDIEPIHLTDEQVSYIKENIKLNITDVADNYPNIDFYYFFSPYSIAWWNDVRNDESLYMYLEAEKLVLEEIVKHPNIHFYSFNNVYEIITNLNHYKDTTHYASWINTLMLKWMKEDKYLITKDNYFDYYNDVYNFYTTYDYYSIENQEDYTNDLDALKDIYNQFGEEVYE